MATARRAPPTTAQPADTKPVQTTTAPTAAPATTAAAAEPMGIASYDAVQPAVVQIVAQGTFRDPEVGFADGSGMGSGFIISPDGLAVTNNHVVAGAATLEVYIGGELDESYNATILGVSECNDLALIDIDAPDDVPYLEWFDGDIGAGLDVYAAGYPLGDPEFTLTRGIIAKAEAGGDLTGTSSIDHTVEHDANIQPGNSGGPLVGRRRQGRRRQLRRGCQRHDDGAVLRHRRRPRPARGREAAGPVTSNRSASTAGPSTTRHSASPASGSPVSPGLARPPRRRSCPATSSPR